MEAKSIWEIKEGDTLNGKKVVKVAFLDDNYTLKPLKIVTLDDGSEYFLDKEGIRKAK